MDKKSNKIKKLITILFLILVVIASLAIVIFFSNRQNGIVPSANNNTDNTNSNELVDNNETNNSNTGNTGATNNTVNSEITNEETLKKVIDMNSYFWAKEVLTDYYSSNDYDEPVTLMDTDVVNELGVTDNNYRKLNDFDAPIFRIDEIYKQKLDTNIYLYIIKNRFGKNKSDVKDSILWAKQDLKNKTFSIYPYEYLRIKNYLDFKEGDKISLESIQPIEKKDENQYIFDNSVDSQDCMKGLFERYKFDLLLDEEHLYDLLDEDYKNSKYQNLNELKQYIANNKTDLYLDNLSEYTIVNYDNYIEYKASCENKRNYVFKVKNMMDYKIMLDSYKVIQNEEMYNSFLPDAQAKYCVDRIIQAINYGDYEFVYGKLNQVQKNNYYKNYNDFKDYITKNFFKENNYELGDDFLIVSEGAVYQFDVKITDATGEDYSYGKFVMTVTLKDNDFEISITTQN